VVPVVTLFDLFKSESMKLAAGWSKALAGKEEKLGDHTACHGLG
jgi:hypothetical protein